MLQLCVTINVLPQVLCGFFSLAEHILSFISGFFDRLINVENISEVSLKIMQLILQVINIILLLNQLI